MTRDNFREYGGARLTLASVVALGAMKAGQEYSTRSLQPFGRQEPFDGVFGFSQGAALASLLVGLRFHDDAVEEDPASSVTGAVSQPKSLAFDFAILVGGFVSTDPDIAKLFREKLSYDLPTVHIIGCSCGPHTTQIKNITISTAGTD